MKLTAKQAKPIVEKVFPDYKGRRFNLEFKSHLTFWDTNWSGGTRNYYVAIKSDGEYSRLPISAPWNNSVEGKTVEIPPDVLIVMRSYYSGKDMGITIYANPVWAPKWLEAAK